MDCRSLVLPLIVGLLASQSVVADADDTALEMRPIVPDGTPGSIKMKLEGSPANVSPQELSCGKEVLLNSSAVKNARASLDPKNGWRVEVELTEKGRQQFRDATTQWKGHRIGIISGGRIISAPVVNEPISGGRLEISGAFTETAVRALADAFMKGVKQDATDPAKKQP
jgi:preprotein translocase subunit SecD